MQEWLTAAYELESSHQPYVLVTVSHSIGSAPRDSGAKMLVSEDKRFGTIGGGALEHQAIIKAREILNLGSIRHSFIEGYDLAAHLGQCCGGKVDLFFEPFFVPEQHKLFLFGAGHIGTALVSLLSDLPCTIYWYDSRPELFPAVLPENVLKFVQSAEEVSTQDFSAAATFLIMTHDHKEDFLICEKILDFQAFDFLGMIGSSNKRRRFEQLMREKNMAPELLQRLESPVGIDGIDSKKPQAVAISVAARILQLWSDI